LAAQNDAQHCNYTSNRCSLSNGEAVLWESNIIEENQFVPWVNVSGHQIGLRWLSDDGIRLLTSTGTSITDTDGAIYRMSHEGIPYVIVTGFYDVAFSTCLNFFCVIEFFIVQYNKS
jgi:hypothetical protein